MLDRVSAEYAIIAEYGTDNNQDGAFRCWRLLTGAADAEGDRPGDEEYGGTGVRRGHASAGSDGYH